MASAGSASPVNRPESLNATCRVLGCKFYPNAIHDVRLLFHYKRLVYETLQMQYTMLAISVPHLSESMLTGHKCGDAAQGYPENYLLLLPESKRYALYSSQEKCWRFTLAACLPGQIALRSYHVQNVDLGEL